MFAVNRGLKRSIYHVLMLLAAGALIASPVMAQISTVDPNDVIDSDLGTPPPAATAAPAQEVAPTVQDGVPTDAPATLPETSTASPAISTEATYQEDDLIGAAEGVFGKSAQGLGKLIENILKKEGRPNGYIVGREVGGAFLVGLRYGSGTLNHKVEGQKPVYWTGPSIGPDAGANGGSTFVLVYNLYDTEDIYERYPGGEGIAYLGGGFNASYLRRGDVVLIPIRVGTGIRLGANTGYMRFSKKQRWLPF
ncbi:DUF1134 domain-containing protein [Sphingorhabdus sp.]|jgi:hypothetical protein|uniref:DUF1134 domain-containing protein n=1 Tax=Sphingorhabdus sp. TaxID=1902408 RepID=UPI00378360BD